MKIVCTMICYDESKAYEPFITPKYLARAGHEVIIVTANLDIHLSRVEAGTQVNGDGIKVIRLPYVLKYGHDFVAVTGFEALLRELSPDLVFLHTARDFFGLTAARLKKRLKYRLFVDHHDFFYHGHSMQPLKTTVRNLIARFDYMFVRRLLSKYVFWKSDCIFPVTGVCHDHLRDFFRIKETKIVPLEFAVDTDIFHFSADARNAIRTEYSFDNKVFVLNYTGLITRRKRVEKLIDLLLGLESRGLQGKTRMLVVGKFMEKDYEHEVRDKIAQAGQEKNIVFVGEVDRNRVSELYSASDLSFWIENNSISILEAMATGCLVAVPELQLAHFVDGNGATFPAGDIEKLSDIIQKYCDLPRNEIEALRAESLRIVDSKYSFASYVERILSAYAE